MPSPAAISAALTTRSTDNRSTPGIEATGSRMFTPLRMKTGQIRSLIPNAFSCANLRNAAEDLRRR